MAALAPPSTGMKKKAQRVFGDAIVDDGDNSLTYSPSPQKQANNKETLAPMMEEDDSSDDSSHQLATGGSSETSTEKENVDLGRTETSKSITTLSSQQSMKERVRDMRMQARSPLSRDLVKKTQDAINKASDSVIRSINAAQSSKHTSFQLKYKKAAKIRREWKEDTSEAKEFNEQAEKSRRELLSLQRQLSSKYSRDKARREMMQRQATLQSVEEESQFKSEIYREHQKKQKEDNDERRRRSVAARSKLRANHKMGEEKLKLARVQEEQVILEERHEASIALRATTQENAKKRRNSFAFRNGDARRIRELHARLEAERKRQQNESFELKRLGEKDAEEYKRQLDKERRDSFAMRNAMGRKQREQESQLRSEKQAAEHESYELKRAAEKDAEAYKRSLEEERRKSFAQRNQHAHRQREQANQEKSDELAAEHESYELKRTASKDAELYLVQVEQDRRDSLAFRNKEGKRQRDLEQQQRSDQIHEQHKSFELKWAGEKDAEDYTRQMEKERRESLAERNREARRQRLQAEQMHADSMTKEHENFELKRAAEKDAEAYVRNEERLRRESLATRNQERVRHAKVMSELQMLAREKETESYVLKWAGEEDAKKYLAKVAEERRQSLKLRGKQILHHREVENEQHQQELLKIHQDEELRSADQKDVETYRKECAERDRKSLEYRRKEARMQRIQKEEREMKQQEIDEKNFNLETLACVDVEEYVKECKQRRRLSLAFRAKEKRRHARWRREQHEEEVEERSRRVRDRLMDQRHVELARQQERARIALDALQHAGCSFNPFSNVLS